MLDSKIHTVPLDEKRNITTEDITKLCYPKDLYETATTLSELTKVLFACSPEKLDEVFNNCLALHSHLRKLETPLHDSYKKGRIFLTTSDYCEILLLTLCKII